MVGKRPPRQSGFGRHRPDHVVQSLLAAVADIAGAGEPLLL
jgi:hypothetical protein